jgi:hypothetical protein
MNIVQRVRVTVHDNARIYDESAMVPQLGSHRIRGGFRATCDQYFYS